MYILQSHRPGDIRTRRFLDDREIWIMSCACGWQVSNQQEDVSWFLHAYADHVYNVLIPLRTGEKVVLPTLTIASIITINGNSQIGLSLPGDDSIVEVPASWCSRIKSPATI